MVGNSADCEPQLEKCSGSKCKGYRGKQTKTINGRTCQRWDSQEYHNHPEDTPAKKPNAGLEGNYCRNPDTTKSIWCYTTDKNKRWELCEPLKCETGIKYS